MRGETAPLTDDSAVLVNAWEHHAYTHPVPPGERTLILALYIEPKWLAEFHLPLAMSGHPRFFPQSCVRVTAATRKITEEFVLELWWADEVSPSRLEELLFNLIISNVPGPPFDLYLAGARVDAMYPMGPLLYGSGINFTVVSDAHQLHFGLLSCPALVPDPWAIADRLPRALGELLAAAADA